MLMLLVLAAIGQRWGYGPGVVAPEGFARLKATIRHVQNGKYVSFQRSVTVRMIHERDARNVGLASVPMYTVEFAFRGVAPRVALRRAKEAAYQFWRGVPSKNWHFTDPFNAGVKGRLKMGALLEQSIGKVDDWPVLVMHDSYDMASIGSSRDKHGPGRKVWVPKAWTPWRDDDEASAAWQQAIAGMHVCVC